ncbi:MAG TPA: phage major capsid protein, partial [Steroidobacteraceae bacterium]|nr:phage major capsid protein [Steroidobacteraceae bacterium]
MSELMQAIEGIGTSFETLKKANDLRNQEFSARLDALQDAKERGEAELDRPGATVRKNSDGIRKLITPNGPAFEIAHNVKMASIPGLGPDKQPDISLQRWLAATVAGDRCGDKEAVEYCRERKAMTTASTGVLIPAEYQTTWIDMLRAQSVLNAAGMRTVGMAAKTQVHSAVTGDPAIGWHSEGGSLSAANPTFAARTLSANTIAARCQATIEL